jgi:adenine/guanine/hypoxanthine permease
MSSAIVGHLDRFFLLSQRGTTVGTEIRAGTASFFTLSYLLLVNPQILVQAGVNHDDAVFATAVSAAISCMVVGLLGNLPFGCAPGLGLSAYLAFGLVQAGLCDLSDALTACWWSGIIVICISVSGIANQLMKVVPHAIKLAIVVGMGLLIAMIGMVSVKLIVANPKTLVELGDVWGESSLQLFLAGVLLVASLLYHDVKGAILIGITLLTLVSWVMASSWPEGIVQIPEYHSNHYWRPWIIFDIDKAAVLAPAIASFVLICIFDISGVMFGVGTLAGIINPATDEVPGSLWAFLASGIGTLVAAWLGSTPIIVCVECASGVREGGRTGLTAVVMSLYFTASIFLAPLFSSVPDVATAPVLVLVGVMMMGESAKISWSNMNEALPAFLTIILMPLTYSITNGMIFGLLTSVAFYFTTGQFMVDSKALHTSCTGDTSSMEEEEVTQLVVNGFDGGSNGHMAAFENS